MTFLLALDQGTSSSRSIVFDPQGRIVAIAQREFRQLFPRPGWVEHDPREIWDSQLATAREALSKAGLAARDIKAIGITNQRETTLVWNRRTGAPIHNAIVWQDRRTEPICAALRDQGRATLVQERTGLVIDPYFSGTKLKWLLDSVPGARPQAARGELAFGTVDAWLVWRLTGGRLHATDVTNASRTMLFDVRRNAWDDELLRMLDVPPELLPSVHPSAHLYGEADAQLLGAPLPIAGIAGDQQSALFGQACFRPGLAKNTYGTGCFLLMHTGERFQASANGLVTTSAAQPERMGTSTIPAVAAPRGGGPAPNGMTAPTLPAAAAPRGGGSPAWGGPAPDCTPEFALEGSVFVAGAVVQWLRDGLAAIQASSEVQALAESVPDSGGVVFVPAFTGLGAPYWKPDARGAIVGLTRGTTAGHIARAALESIAFQSAALLAAMSRDAQAAGERDAGAAGGQATGTPSASPPQAGAGGLAQPGAVAELRVDGGACVNDLLMQFQADLLGIPVVRPKVIETTALGAAYLAGLATGVYRNLDQLAAQWQAERTFYPTLPRDRAAELMAQWERAVRQTVAA